MIKDLAAAQAAMRSRTPRRKRRRITYAISAEHRITRPNPSGSRRLIPSLSAYEVRTIQIEQKPGLKAAKIARRTKKRRYDRKRYRELLRNKNLLTKALRASYKLMQEEFSEISRLAREAREILLRPTKLQEKLTLAYAAGFSEGRRIGAAEGDSQKGANGK